MEQVGALGHQIDVGGQGRVDGVAHGPGRVQVRGDALDDEFLHAPAHRGEQLHLVAEEAIQLGTRYTSGFHHVVDGEIGPVGIDGADGGLDEFGADRGAVRVPAVVAGVPLRLRALRLGRAVARRVGGHAADWNSIRRGTPLVRCLGQSYTWPYIEHVVLGT